jgi:multidrug efflux system outer membrane protein
MMSKAMMRKFLSLLPAFVLTGCFTLEPDYQRPAAPVPASWPTGDAYPAQTASAGPVAADIGWNDFFVDPKLKRLIALGLANNRDLRVAVLNIEKSRAQYDIQRADQLPTLDAQASGTIQRTGRLNTQTGSAQTTHSYTVGAGVSAYELDLFGRVQSLKDQALEQYFATAEAQRSTQISLVSEIASDYLTLAADQERLKLAQDTLLSQQQSLALTQRQFQVGTASELDVRQAETSVETAQVDVAKYTAQAAQDRNALALVLGAPVPDDALPGGPVDVVTGISDIPAGVSSAVLLRRPDVLEAEHTLLAANANIGAARAAFFPKITLTASGGSTADALKTLFKAGTGGWSFAPDIVWPIFDWGANQANLDSAKVDKQIYVADYEKAIQTAFREVADALADRGTLEGQLSAQQALVNSTAASYRLSDARYRKGVSSYLDVLDSQRSLYSAQQDLITVRLSRVTNLVTLYKVLGGGALAHTGDAVPSPAETAAK